MSKSPSPANVAEHLRRLVLVVAFAVVSVAAVGPTYAHAAASFSSFTTTLTPNGAFSLNQAGAHPDLTTSFTVAQNPDNTPVENVRNLQVDLPPGMIGNPTATPKCAMARITDALVSNPCPLSAAVGFVSATVFIPGGSPYTANSLIYNIEPYQDEPAAFGANPFFPLRLDVSVRSNGDYGIRATARNITEQAPVISATLTLWGVPTDHNGPYAGVGTAYPDDSTGRTAGGPGDGLRLPFLTNPTACGTADLPVSAAVSGWVTPSVSTTASSTLPAITGCDALAFDPSIRVRPQSRQAHVPSGYSVDIDVPQNDDAGGLATPSLKDAKVTMPDGVVLSPAVAHGLGACTNKQVGLHELGDDNCPDNSKIGTVSITTPLLSGPLEGSVYIGEPLPGNRYRVFFSLAGFGVNVKLEGRISPDSRTGQITATFLDNPQLPFSNLHVDFKGGPDAPLANPSTCGTKTATSELTSFAGQTATPNDSFAIDEGCTATRFAPTWTAGSVNPVAGGSSPFVLRVTRDDSDELIDHISADLPAGLLGMVSQVPLCPVDRARAGTCGSESQIGTTRVAAGPGTDPFALTGKTFLTEGHDGAPYGLAFSVPAIAGPYDLGVVNVLARITVDRTTAALHVESDSLPTILEGIPLQIRDVAVTIDRPGFMRNPTSCAPASIGGKVTSNAGTLATTSSPFQVGDCGSLRFAPLMSLTTIGAGQTKDGSHPGLVATVTQTKGQAALKKAAVTLPLSLALDPDNAQALCKPEQAAALACPATSIVGHAEAVTPVLRRPLQGPVYFVEGRRLSPSGRVIKTLPKLWIPLSGEVVLDLHADTAVSASEKLVTTFSSIPDAPISAFKLTIDGGRHGILAANTNICAARQVASVDTDAQSGGRSDFDQVIATSNCATKVLSSRVSSKSVAVKVGGIGAGTVKVSGRGVRTTSRKIVSANAATVTAPLTASVRRLRARHRKVSLSLTVTFTPKDKMLKPVSRKIRARG